MSLRLGPVFSRLRIGLTIVLLAVAPGAFSQSTAILIIDDMGNGLELGQRALRLPGKVNYAFLPHTPNGPQLARLAHRRGQEVLLHLPMSNLSEQAAGPGKLSPAMDRGQFNAALERNLASIPYVRGVNNHMGSLLTQLHQPMRWLMEGLKRHHLYFIDSRTSPLTVAERTARRQQLPTLRRDVFLDNRLEAPAIRRQIERWLELAQDRGLAVAIAHPHPQTLAALEASLPTLDERGIRLALISEILTPTLAQRPGS